MKTVISRIFAVGLLLVSAPVVAQEITKQQTPAGIEYWYQNMSDAKRTAVSMIWQHNLPNGDAHITASRLAVQLMLKGGAGGKLPDTIIADFEDLDGGAKLFVQPREIRGFIVAPKSNLLNAAEISNDVLARPNFDKKWFAREKKNLVDNASNQSNNSFGIGWKLSRAVMLGDHQYAQFWSLSPVEEIANLALDDVKGWHNNNFNIEGIKITVAGDAPPELIGLAIDRALEGLPRGVAGKSPALTNSNVPAATIVFHKPDLPKSLVLIFGKLPPAKAGKDVSLIIASGVLGLGKQSRLFKAVRSGLRAAYGFKATRVNFTRDTRVLAMHGEVETALLQKTLSEVEETYEEFRTSGIGFIEFPLAKRFYRQRIEAEKKKPTSVAYMMMELLQEQNPLSKLTNLEATIDGLDRTEVNAMIAETFPEYSAMLKIIVTPDAEIVEGACVITQIDQVQKCLEQ